LLASRLLMAVAWLRAVPVDVPGEELAGEVLPVEVAGGFGLFDPALEPLLCSSTTATAAPAASTAIPAAIEPMSTPRDRRAGGGPPGEVGLPGW
jgi:hypothetical protein